MTSPRDADQLLDRWLGDGPTQVADRVLDSVADRIGSEPQLPGWRVTWRESNVNRYLMPAAGLAAAAIVVVTIVGYNFLAQQPAIGGPAATPTPAPTASPQALPDGTLSGGRYLFEPFTSSNMTIAADVPAGWHGVPSWAVTGPLDNDAPRGIAIALLLATGLHSDPCQWDRAGTGSNDQPGDVEVRGRAAELVNALLANSSYTSTEPSRPTVDTYRGYEMEIQLPSDLDDGTCDVDESGEGRYFVFSGPDAGLWAHGDLLHLFIVDVEGTRVIAAVPYFKDTPPADLAAALAVIRSFEFMP
jgi:hypothetical protein